MASEGLSRTRKVLTGAAMAGTAGVIAHAGLTHFGLFAPLVSTACMLALAGVGMTRRSLVVQVLSRAAAWTVFAPAAASTLAIALNHGRVELDLAAMALCTGTALAASRPMLHTAEARAAFAPNVFRRWFLAGSITTAAAGWITSYLVLMRHILDGPAETLGLAALAASFFASSIAVLRMRSWGIFLGAITSVLLLTMGVATGEGAMVIASAPALLMYVLPVLLARWTGSPQPRANLANGTSDASQEQASTSTQYRVALHELDPLDDIEAEPARAVRHV